MPVALKRLAEEVGEGLGLPKPGILDFTVEVPAALMVDADPDQLYRVLGNLYRNAVQVLDAAGAAHPGSLTVRGFRNGAGTIIEVGDNGPGIPERARANLFVPFQGGARPGGTGLGLAIVQELVRAHGGTVVLAQNGGGGATFRIEIPDGSAGRQA